MFQNFTVLYIKMGFPRLPSDQQVSLLQQLVSCIPGRPEPQQNTCVTHVDHLYCCCSSYCCIFVVFEFLLVFSYSYIVFIFCCQCCDTVGWVRRTASGGVTGRMPQDKMPSDKMSAHKMPLWLVFEADWQTHRLGKWSISCCPFCCCECSICSARIRMR